MFQKSSVSWIALCAAFLLMSVRMTWGEDRQDEVQRVKQAADALNEIVAVPDQEIPQEIMESAVCVAVAPSLKKGGFVFGAEYGKGVATCRNANGWSAPAFFTVAGGSWGLQIGAEAVDLVMLVMNNDGMEKLLSSKFKLGADASVAAGPVGRHAEGETDWKMRTEVLTYSRARGVFAGLTLNGAVIQQDDDATRAFYGRQVSFHDILQGKTAAPNGSQPFLAAVKHFSAKAEAAELKEARPEEHK